MLENKDFCDYDTCVALKELGYNRGAYAYYFPNHKEDLIFNTHPMRGCSINEMVRGYNTYSKDTVGHELIDAPTMWEAQKWLREEKGVVVLVHHLITEEGDWEWEISYRYRSKGMYHSYEEALFEGIKEAIKLLKEKEDE